MCSIQDFLTGWYCSLAARRRWAGAALSPGPGKHFNRWPNPRYWKNPVFIENKYRHFQVSGHEKLWLKLLTGQHRQVLPKVSGRAGPGRSIPKGSPLGRTFPSRAGSQWVCDHRILGRKRKLTLYWDFMSPSSTIYFNNITHSGI